MKKIRITLLLMLVACFCLSAFSVQAKDTEFGFYYQRIKKVVQINNPEPKGWWENTKAFVKKGVNLVKKTWENAVTRNYALGEGTKRWYSGEDSNIAYDVERVKVKSVEHLLELMGAKSEDELTDGQKALVAVYKHSQSQAVKDRMKYSYRSKINVILSDTTGFDDPAKYKHVSDDFWPYSSGPTIQMSSGRYNWTGSQESAQSTFVHEFAHSFDRTIKEFINPYGKDGSHFANEMTKPRTAFVEGWAQFNEMLDSDMKIRNIKSAVVTIKIEDKKKSGDYTTVEASTLSGKQLLSVEGINALILHRMATEIDNGKDKVFQSFTSTSWKLLRDVSTITREMAKKNPSDIAMIGKIVDEQTLGKLSDKEMMDLIGDSAAAKEFLKNRAAAKNADQEETPVSATAVGGVKAIKVKTDGNNPFSVE